jgi:hypothetical protein
MVQFGGNSRHQPSHREGNPTQERLRRHHFARLEIHQLKNTEQHVHVAEKTHQSHAKFRRNRPRSTRFFPKRSSQSTCDDS